MAIIVKEVINPETLSYNTKPIKIEIADKQKAKLIQGFINGLYVNLYSWVREIICNAIDANNHKSIQTGDKTKRVKLYFTESLPMLSNINSFVIQDYGLGMDEDDIYNIYSQFGTSTKEDSNDDIGNYGIGSKSPLKYSSVFYLESSKNGITYIYSVGSINNEDYGISLLTKYESDKIENSNEYVTGTKVIIPLKSTNTSANTEKNNIIEFIANNMKIDKSVIDFDYTEYKIEPWIKYEDDDFILVDKDISLNRNDKVLLYANLYYKLPFTLNYTLTHSTSYTIIPKFKIGEIKPSQSREWLDESDFNKTAINNKLELISKTIQRLYKEDVQLHNDILNNKENYDNDTITKSINFMLFQNSHWSNLLSVYDNNSYKQLQLEWHNKYKLNSLFGLKPEYNSNNFASLYHYFLQVLKNNNVDLYLTNTDESIVDKISKFGIFKLYTHKDCYLISGYNNKTLLKQGYLSDLIDNITSLKDLNQQLRYREWLVNHSLYKDCNVNIIVGNSSKYDLHKFYRNLEQKDVSIKYEIVLLIDLDELKQLKELSKDSNLMVCSDEFIQDLESLNAIKDIIADINEQNKQLNIDEGIIEEEYKKNTVKVKLGKLKYIHSVNDKFSYNYKYSLVESEVDGKTSLVDTFPYRDYVNYSYTDNNFDLIEYSKKNPNKIIIYCKANDLLDENEFALFYIKYKHLPNWEFYKLSKDNVKHYQKHDIGIYFRDFDKYALDTIDYIDYMNRVVFNERNIQILNSVFLNTCNYYKGIFDFVTGYDKYSVDIRSSILKYNDLPYRMYLQKNNASRWDFEIDTTLKDSTHELSTHFNQLKLYLTRFNMLTSLQWEVNSELMKDDNNWYSKSPYYYTTSYKNSNQLIDWIIDLNNYYGKQFD